MRRARELAGFGASMCAVATLFAIPALYVPGIAALLAATVAPAWVRLAAAGAELWLTAAADTVEEGDRVRVQITVARRRMPSPQIVLLPGPGCAEVMLSGRQAETVEVSVLALRRGRQQIGPARLRVADPLGICVREVLSPERELLVLPRVERLDRRAREQLAGRGSLRRTRTPAGDSLRPYRPGAPAARIHWPTVARTGTLMERGEIADGEPGVLVVLDAERPESASALDQAIRATASICLHLARSGGCELLLPGATRPLAVGADLRSWPALLRSLALVQPGVATRPGAGRGGSTAVLQVTASSDTAPASGRRHIRVGPRAIMGPPVSFRVAGCSAQSLEAGAWARSG